MLLTDRPLRTCRLLLNGIAGGAQGITGQLQLFSVERNVSQPVPAHSGTFATIAADEAEMFCFADKAEAGGGTFKLSKIGGAGAAMGPVQTAYAYPPQVAQAAASDFPVAMTASAKYDVAYMLTKMGFLFVIDTKTGAVIFSNQVSAQVGWNYPRVACADGGRSHSGRGGLA
jgi:clathrin heavy chain